MPTIVSGSRIHLAARERKARRALDKATRATEETDNLFDSLVARASSGALESSR